MYLESRNIIMSLELIKQGLEQTKISNETLTLMLDNIGSLDPVLRDETIYIGFARNFMEGLFSLQQKQMIYEYIFDRNLLLTGLDEGISDDTFTRAFTSLVLVVVMESHYMNPWLDTDQESRIIETALYYMEHEQDNRGFVEDKGWAHAFAHGADLLGTITKSPLFTQDHTARFLTIYKRALIDIDNFLYKEEGRLARGSVELIASGKIDSPSLVNWIDTVSKDLYASEGYNLAWQSYLMALSFLLKFENLLNDDLNQVIDESLKLHYERFHCV